MLGSSDDNAIANVRSDLDALRKDISSLAATFDKSARINAKIAADQINDGFRGLSRGAFDSGQQSAKALGTLMEEKPLLTLLLAIGVGYLGIRTLLR